MTVDLKHLTYDVYLAMQELQEKLQDYQTIRVREAWVISSQGRTVEVLVLSPEAIQRSGLYGLGDAIASQVLPDLHLIVNEIFPEL
ncbi:MAG: Uma2 family endonuclease [Nitrospinae bacterium]|nr:Uma2 family endonuclease [Nitrospinota bacterium]